LSARRLKFLIVEDHPLVREGVRLALQTLEAEVAVLEAGNAEEATQLAEQHPDLDLVLLDLGLPGADGFAIFERLRRRAGTLPIMIFSASDARSNVMTALNMGAAGFISKTSSKEIILQAIRLALAGGTYIPPQALDAPKGERPGAQPVAAELGLTERQLEVLAQLAQGKPNKVIARELDIAEPTVKAHVTEILRALKVTNRAQAVVAARKIGFD
jgi:DNA-binding NarL/FixJ family response regulator